MNSYHLGMVVGSFIATVVLFVVWGYLKIAQKDKKR